MSIGFGHLASVLRGMHPDADETSIEARVRYFQRRGFPNEDAAVGKGWRAEYGARDVMKLVCAFELLAAFVPPAQAIGIVTESWKAVEETLRGAWLERTTREFSLPLLLRGVGVGAKGETEGSLVAVTMDDLRGWLQGRGDQRVVMTVDAVRLVKALDAALGNFLPPDRAERMRTSLNGWAAARR